MNLKKIKKLRAELGEIRRFPHGRTARDMIAVASAIGRVRADRGAEPTYVRDHDPALPPPLSVPGHAGDLKQGTVRNIVDTLLSDLDRWEIFLLGTKHHD